MNFVDGRIVEDGTAIAFWAASVSLPLPSTTAQQLKSRRGGEVVLGIRPEHIHEPDSSGDAQHSGNQRLLIGLRDFLEYESLYSGQGSRVTVNGSVSEQLSFVC